MIALLLGLGVVAAVVQAAVLPAFYASAWATPVPAAALIAAWAVTRRPYEAWPIALTAAIVLGVVSVERSGWFLMALLPTVGLAMVLDRVSPRSGGFGARLGRAVAAAMAGTVGYVALLALASSGGAVLLTELRAIAIAATSTALLAAVIVVTLLPFRPRPTGLFGP